MVRIILSTLLLLAGFTLCLGQDTAGSEKNSKLIIKADTQFSAKSSQQISAESTKPGADFNLTLAEDLKGIEGMIAKGSEVFGRVIKVEKLPNESSASEITIIFDFIKNGEDFIPLHALVIAIENQTDPIKLKASENIPGGTVFSLQGKNLTIEQDTLIRIKLTEDINFGG
ncbi:MAG: hypothetical protein KDB79_03630 [Acidobacteria bacterium]|nr:hypothetical protein [Acidobacteriota bacterium]